MSWRVWSWALLWAVHRSRRSPHSVSSSVRAFSCPSASLSHTCSAKNLKRAQRFITSRQFEGQARSEPRYIGPDGRSRPSLSKYQESSTVSFLSGFLASSLTARAVEHDGPVLPHAARTCRYLAFRQTLVGIVFRAFPPRVSAVRRQ